MGQVPNQDGAIVPQLWHAEVRNALLQEERRGRITPAQTRDMFLELADIRVVTDNSPDYNTVLRLAELHDLSIYDALYLELAKRSGLELATLESRLGQAAAREGSAHGNRLTSRSSQPQLRGFGG